MPWSNQNGGGGPWGGRGKNNGQSPWGKGGGDANGGDDKPSAPQGGGPDIDEFLRRGQDKLKQAGTGVILLVILILAILFWLYQCFFIVQQNERAIELRFGQPKEGVVMDGLHFRLWPIETYRIAPLTEQNIQIGRASAANQRDGLMLSGDQNIVNVRFSVYYNIDNPVDYLFNVAEPVKTIRQVAESAMREVVGRRPIDDVYRDKREDVAQDVLKIIQSIVDKYGLGVRITRVSISEAAPPSRVAAAFNSVQQAEQERNRLIEEGNKYQATKLGQANGEASRKRAEAAGEKASMIEEAQGRAQRFKALAETSTDTPDMVRYRLYMETIGKLLSQPNKLILDPSKSGAVPYLPLSELLKAKPEENALTTTNLPKTTVMSGER